MDNQIQIVTSGFIQKEDLFLIVKRAPDETFLPNVWELPGGKSEPNENPNVSVVREIKEECGIDIIAIKPLIVKSYISQEKRKHYVEIFYDTKPVDSSQQIILSREHSDFAWIDRENLGSYREEMTEYIYETIIKILNEKKV